MQLSLTADGTSKFDQEQLCKKNNYEIAIPHAANKTRKEFCSFVGFLAVNILRFTDDLPIKNLTKKCQKYLRTKWKMC